MSVQLSSDDVSLSKRAHILENNTSLRKFLQDRRGYLLLKRLFDIVFSLLVVLLVLSWLFPLLCILIRLDSKGPVLFVQRRVGFMGRSFRCLKFRTMRVNREADVLQSTENDPRVTRMGRLLRDSNLDELPQFINVLIGHMSIVGPRPHMYKDCQQFSSVVETYKVRNLMKPGITGLAQVKGYRGPAHDFNRIFLRFQWDAYYIKNAHFLFDVRIVHMTTMQTLGIIVGKFFPGKQLSGGMDWADTGKKQGVPV
ncbi:MAG TPA: sugar transferase [Puia sp.]|jgi:putative colanic acid biosynthesis UDP-glucose lipid carrier transferase|nr:sugar transferase [Puia sp.]